MWRISRPFWPFLLDTGSAQPSAGHSQGLFQLSEDPCRAFAARGTCKSRQKHRQTSVNAPRSPKSRTIRIYTSTPCLLKHVDMRQMQVSFPTSDSAGQHKHEMAQKYAGGCTRMRLQGICTCFRCSQTEWPCPPAAAVHWTPAQSQRQDWRPRPCAWWHRLEAVELRLMQRLSGVTPLLLLALLALPRPLPRGRGTPHPHLL